MARQRARDMAEKNYMAHAAPTGETSASIIMDEDAKFQGLLGENIAAQHYLKAYGLDVDVFAHRFVDTWLKSQSHHDNLAYALYNRTGRWSRGEWRHRLCDAVVRDGHGLAPAAGCTAAKRAAGSISSRPSPTEEAIGPAKSAPNNWALTLFLQRCFRQEAVPSEVIPVECGFFTLYLDTHTLFSGAACGESICSLIFLGTWLASPRRPGRLRVQPPGAKVCRSANG